MSNHEWWKSAVFYQIYPRSFMDSTGNGIGDLNGITGRLEYLKDLGIDALWISPFFKSPMADFGYDVSDYRSVDPLFGSNEDFDILLNKAHDLGLKIIVDMVLSHTSIEHPWFVESRTSKDNPKSDWYVWVDPKPDGSPPNNWVSVFGGSAWQFDEARGQYYLHNFLTSQPDLNYHNLDVQNAVLDECQYWLDKGVDGFRLDVINFIFHDKQLRDNPPKDPAIDGYATQLEKPDPYNDQHHIYDKSRPEALEFIGRLRALTDQYDDIFTLAEIGDDKGTVRAAEYVSSPQRLNSAYSFSLMTGDTITPEKIINAVTDFFNQPGEGWPSWAFENHDVMRSVSRWGENIQDKEAFSKLLIQILLTLRGTPFLYQGEELGLSEATLTLDQLQDPWGKHHWPEWQGRDGCRTPMPWNKDQPNAGFSNADETWLPVSKEHRDLSVDIQSNRPNSTLNFTKKFIAWCKTKPTLQLGDIDFLDVKNPHILGYERSLENNKITCLFNLSEKQQEFENIILETLEAKFIEE